MIRGMGRIQKYIHQNFPYTPPNITFFISPNSVNTTPQVNIDRSSNSPHNLIENKLLSRANSTNNLDRISEKKYTNADLSTYSISISFSDGINYNFTFSPNLLVM